MTESLALLKMIVFCGYAYLIYKRYGVLPSVSASTYALKGQDRYYFTGMMWTLAILVLFQPIDAFAVWVAAGLGFSGVSIEFRENTAGAYWVHYIGTVFAIAAGYAAFVFLFGWWIPLASFLGGSVALYFRYGRKYIWYVEIWAMIVACVTLLFV